ncbi:MAG: DUF2059 domain-containing protein [Alphaproteobacteria bacterium]|nr:DUF2059 domain-containing protein [Alphaproteobacteria bacterium]
MRRVSALLISAIFVISTAAPASAQTMLLPVLDVVGSDGPGSDDSRMLVDELLVLLQYDRLTERIIDRTATEIVRSVRVANPSMTDAEAQAVRQLFEDAVRRSAPDLTQISRAMLLRHYSEAELRDLVAFYRTPTGQKSIRLTPELTGAIASRATDAVGRTVPPIVDALSARLRAAGYKSPDFKSIQ